MVCEICKSGNRCSPNHSYGFRHRKKLIQLFKMYNEKKKGKHPDEYDKIYEATLQQFINI